MRWPLKFPSLENLTLFVGQGVVIPLGRSHYHFCRCRVQISEKAESHKIQVWELGIATSQRIPNSTIDSIQNYACAILVMGQYVRGCRFNHKRNSFLFWILKSLSFSWSHLWDSMDSLTLADSPLASQSLASSASFQEVALLPSAREIMSFWMEARFAEASEGLNQSLLSCSRNHQTGGQVMFNLRR